MWIQRRTPRSVRSAETASSKSCALAGSTVKVARSLRSRRSKSRDFARSVACSSLLLHPAGEAGADLAILQHRRDHVGGDPGVPELADHLRPSAALAEIDQGHAPGGRRAASAAELDLPAALEEELADEEAAALPDEDYAFQS